MRTIALRRGLAALLVAALSYGVQADEKSANTLRIGYQKYGTLVLLKARGTLEKRLAEDGVKVQWTEFPGGPQLLEGLNVGSIDFGVTGETPPVFAQAAGADLLYVAYEPPAPTSEAILLPKDSPIRSVAGFEGQESRPEQGLQRALPVGPRPRAGRPEVQRHPTRLPAAGRRPRRLRASQRRRLGDLGPLPGRRREAVVRAGPGGWSRSWSTTTSSTSPPGLTRNGIRRCSTS